MEALSSGNRHLDLGPGVVWLSVRTAPVLQGWPSLAFPALALHLLGSPMDPTGSAVEDTAGSHGLPSPCPWDCVGLRRSAQCLDCPSAA